MKKLALIITTILLANPLLVHAKSAQNAMISQSQIQELSDKQALRELIDRFAILADTKQIDEQMTLFIDNPSVTSREAGRESTIVGKDNIHKAFSDYLAQFHTVYHFNGQQLVDIKENHATGTYYSTVTLIKDVNGKDEVLVRDVIYQDEYQKVNGKWLIHKRIANFVTRDVQIRDKP